MSNFTASSGVELDKHGFLITPITGENEEVHEARKEFYQHLRDKELGRWRDLEAPNFVVYESVHDTSNWVRVVDENTGHAALHCRNKMGSHEYGDTAARYFEAHPEPKPWHSATEGDLWEVKYPWFTVIAMVSDKAEFVFTDKSSNPITDENIIGGTRLWPKEEEK